MKADCPAVLFRYAAVLAALLCAALPLSARSSSRYTIYIAPVSGTGKGPGDNAFFAGALTAKLAANNVTAAGDPERADFILTPELSPMPGQKPSDHLYLLRITLTDRITAKTVTEQDLIYSTQEEADSLLKVTMGNVFYLIGEIHRIMTEWRSKWLYLGVSAFWSPRIYYGTIRATKLLNFGGSVSAELQFLDFMSAETGAALVPEWIGKLYVNSEGNYDWILEIPLLLKFAVKPGINYLIQPYGGVHANFPVHGVCSPPLLSWCAGVQYGIKAGPGIFFIDARLSMDIDASRPKKTKNTATILYSNKYKIDAGLGYKFGLFSR